MRPSLAPQLVEHLRMAPAQAVRVERLVQRVQPGDEARHVRALLAPPAAPRPGPTARPWSAPRRPPQLQRIAHVLDADALDRAGGARHARSACRGCAGRRSGWSWLQGGQRRRATPGSMTSIAVVRCNGVNGVSRKRQPLAAGRTTDRRLPKRLSIDCSMPAASSPHIDSSLAGSPCSTNLSGRPSCSTGSASPCGGQALAAPRCRRRPSRSLPRR